MLHTYWKDGDQINYNKHKVGTDFDEDDTVVIAKDIHKLSFERDGTNLNAIKVELEARVVDQKNITACEGDSCGTWEVLSTSVIMRSRSAS